MDMLKAALKYAEMGFSVIPVAKDKKPYIKWEPYQKQKADKEQITEWWTKHPEAGIAIVTGSISGVCVVDIDTPEGEQAFKDKVGEIKCPVVLTPGGGKHLYFEDFGASNKTGFIPGVDFRGEGGYIIAPPSPGPNGSNKVYAWVKELKITTIAPPPPAAQLLELIKNSNIDNRVLSTENLVLSNISLYIGEPVTGSKLDFSEGHRDETLFHVANTLTKTRMPESEMWQVLEILAASCVPPFPFGELKEKIKSALKRKDAIEKTITQEVREFVEVTKGNFRVTDVEHWVTRVTTNNKPIMMALHRLVKEGLIEKMKAPSTYRVIDSKAESVNIKNVAQGEWMEFALPFELNRYVKIAPGNLVIIAGVTNSGKSALMFNLLKDNMTARRSWYFSSEMNKETVKGRLMKYDDEVDWDFEIIENWDQNIDVIKPDDFNFIDWLEAGEEPYKVADLVSRIQRKMRKGVVVVAMQKNPGTGYPFGGNQTISHSSLCLAIDKQFPGEIMKVIKAKAFDDINPNGFVTKFKIINGIKLIQDGTWLPELNDHKKESKVW